ncbi:hypothetical protein CsSME_00051860 [Camellia sinensis var. sinensis]
MKDLLTRSFNKHVVKKAYMNKRFIHNFIYNTIGFITDRTDSRFSNQYSSDQTHQRTCTRVQRGTGSPPANPLTSKLEKEVDCRDRLEIEKLNLLLVFNVCLYPLVIISSLSADVACHFLAMCLHVIGSYCCMGLQQDPWNTGKPWAFGIIRFTYLFANNQNIPSVNSFVADDTPLQHFLNFLAPASEAIRRHTREMTQEEATTARVNPLGDDDAVDLAEQYRTECREGEGASQVVRARPRTIISAARPISQEEPNHWHTKPDKFVLIAEELEGIRKKYQIPSEIGLRLPTTTERASDVRPGEFSLYEEALRGGLRLPLPQVVVEVLKKLEAAPRQLMSNAWKIVMACASAWSQATGGAAMTVEEFFFCYKASGQQETWVTLQAATGRGLVAGLPSSWSWDAYKVEGPYQIS